MKRLALTIASLVALINVALIPAAQASCDPVTLHGSGCTTTIRCLPTYFGKDCL